MTGAGLALGLWWAMATWVPPGDQTRAWGEPEAAAAARYADLAAAIATVALDPAEAPVPGLAADDETARVRSAFILASVASFESAFAADVVSCRRRGPGGSAGPFQTHRSIGVACRSVVGAARVALDMLRESFRVCHRLPIEDRLALYTDGVCREEPRARVRFWRAERAWRYFDRFGLGATQSAGRPHAFSTAAT